MTVRVTEKTESPVWTDARDGKSSTVDRIYTISGTADVTAAIIALKQSSPTVMGSAANPPILYRQTVKVEPQSRTVWIGSVHYDSTVAEPFNADDSIEFDSSGGTQRIQQSIAVVDEFGTPSDSGGLIGATDQGAGGVDVYVPASSMTITLFLPEISADYRALLLDLQCTKNSNVFFGFDPGEVLFVEWSARKEINRRDRPWSLTLKFLIQSNRASFAFGSFTVPFKEGWDYLDGELETVEDTDAKRLTSRLIGGRIHQVYQASDFTLLGLTS